MILELLREKLEKIAEPLQLTESVQYRIEEIERKIERLDEPESEQIALQGFNTTRADYSQVIEERVVCCPCSGVIDSCWLGVLRLVGYTYGGYNN